MDQQEENKEETKQEEDKNSQKEILSFVNRQSKNPPAKEKKKRTLRKGSSVALLIMFSLCFLLFVAALVLQILAIFTNEALQGVYEKIGIAFIVVFAVSVILAIVLTKMDKNHRDK